jgi:DNA-binding MarR family transcriptional regulator
VPTEDALARGAPPDAVALPGAEHLAAETWLRIVQVHDRITRRVDSALHREHQLSLTGFEALRRIAEAPGERASMGEVADAIGLSRAGVTSTVDRLVTEGLVLRERGGPDKRLADLLTPLGDDAGVVTDALARVSAAHRSPR